MAARRASVGPTSDELKPLPTDSHDIISDLSPSMEDPMDTAQRLEPLSIDQMYHSQRKQDKTSHWRNNAYAAGLVDVTWRDEVQSNRIGSDADEANGPNRRCCSDVASEEMDPSCGCLMISGIVCGRLDAGRIGNMAVLREKNVMVEEPDLDCEVGEEGEEIPMKLVSKRVPDLIVGPYWPMLMCVTYPLIIGVSSATAIKAIFVPNQSMALIVIWNVLTFGLCYALFNVGFRDPGILPKYKTAPKSTGAGRWRWNEKAQTFKPPMSMYDPDCAVVIEEFDHTCPWTGTGIGKKNMPAFQAFIALLFICLIMDIILLTTSSISVP